MTFVFRKSTNTPHTSSIPICSSPAWNASSSYVCLPYFPSSPSSLRHHPSHFLSHSDKTDLLPNPRSPAKPQQPTTQPSISNSPATSTSHSKQTLTSLGPCPDSSDLRPLLYPINRRQRQRLRRRKGRRRRRRHLRSRGRGRRRLLEWDSRRAVWDRLRSRVSLRVVSLLHPRNRALRPGV